MVEVVAQPRIASRLFPPARRRVVSALSGQRPSLQDVGRFLVLLRVRAPCLLHRAARFRPLVPFVGQQVAAAPLPVVVIAHRQRSDALVVRRRRELTLPFRPLLLVAAGWWVRDGEEEEGSCPRAPSATRTLFSSHTYQT